MIPTRYQDAEYESVPQDIRDRFEKIRETRRGMYIHGPVGTGKTHIAYALKKHWDEKGGKSIFWNTTELLRSIKNDFDKKLYDRDREEERIMGSRGLLFLDDIGSEKITDFVAETFYLIINHRYQENLPIIFTSNLPIADLADRVGDRTASRIVEMCDVIELVGEDRRMESVQKVQVNI
jgi:DNA replication protein DnaC